MGFSQRQRAGGQCRLGSPLRLIELWVLRSTLNVEATDTTLAPGEGASSDHTFRLPVRHQQREIHVPLPYQLSPLDVVSLPVDLGRDRGQDQVLAELAQ